MKVNPEVHKYFLDGCGRCPLGGTPSCKVHNWDNELDALRTIILEHDLKEEVKWGVPCYTLNGKNVIILSALKDCCVISFFKGMLMKDDTGLLQKPGPNTYAERIFRIYSMNDIISSNNLLHSLIEQAIAIERTGTKIEYPKSTALDLPQEFQQKLENDPALKTAFESLTPGRQKGYILFFSSPKQPQTRIGRIEKSIPLILMGKGLHD